MKTANNIVSPLHQEVPYKVVPNVIHGIDVLALLDSISGENIIDMAIIDPPYNIGKDFGNNHDNITI